MAKRGETPLLSGYYQSTAAGDGVLPRKTEEFPISERDHCRRDLSGRRLIPISEERYPRNGWLASCGGSRVPSGRCPYQFTSPSPTDWAVEFLHLWCRSKMAKPQTAHRAVATTPKKRPALSYSVTACKESARQPWARFSQR